METISWTVTGFMMEVCLVRGKAKVGLSYDGGVFGRRQGQGWFEF